MQLNTVSRVLKIVKYNKLNSRVTSIMVSHLVIATSADACGEVTGCDAGCQEVGRCKGGSQGMYITFASAKQ